MPLKEDIQRKINAIRNEIAESGITPEHMGSVLSDLNERIDEKVVFHSISVFHPGTINAEGAVVSYRGMLYIANQATSSLPNSGGNEWSNLIVDAVAITSSLDTKYDLVTSNLVERIDEVESEISESIQVTVEDLNNADLVIDDGDGNELLSVVDGHIVTSNFNSSELVSAVESISVEDYDGADLVIADDEDNALIVFSNGHLRMSEFDSSVIYGGDSIDF